MLKKCKGSQRALRELEEMLRKCSRNLRISKIARDLKESQRIASDLKGSQRVLKDLKG